MSKRAKIKKDKLADDQFAQQKENVLDWLRNSKDTETQALRQFAFEWLANVRYMREQYKKHNKDLRRQMQKIWLLVGYQDGKNIVEKVENATGKTLR